MSRLGSSASEQHIGWALDATTDRTFNRDYRIPGANYQDLLSTIYLTGMNDRNYFEHDTPEGAPARPSDDHWATFR